MEIAAQSALWIAGVLTGIVALGLVYVLGRRGLGALLMRRLNRRVAQVERVVQEHLSSKNTSVDRLLFQLGQLQDREAAEIALHEHLDSSDRSVGRSLVQVYDSLGLVERYIQDLTGAKKWTRRAAAARALGQLGIVRAIPHLVVLMRDPHEDARTVKLAAAQALGEMQVEEAIPILLRELESPDEWASSRLAELLVAFGSKAIPALIEALGDGQQINSRVWAAQVLGRVGDPVAVDALIGRLQDRSDRVRMSAAEALGRLKDQRAVPDLSQLAMRDPVAPVRAEAARALGALGDPLALDNLVLLLHDHDYWTRLRAIEAIELLRPEDSSALESMLEDASTAVRSRAAVALQRIGVLERCLKYLEHPDKSLAERAMDTLTRLGKAGLSDSILAAVENSSFRIRARIATVIGRIGDLSAITVLEPLLADPLWPVRVRAIESIAALRPADGALRLLPTLSDVEESVRVAGAKAIRTIGLEPKSAAIAEMIELFTQGNAEARCAVLDTVGQLKSDEVDDVLHNGLVDPNAEVRLRAVHSLTGRVSERWTEHLVACLGDSDTRIRAKAVEGLGALSSPEASRAIAMSLSTPDRVFREALTEVLAREGVQAVIDLAGHVRDVDGRLALIWALGKTEDIRAVETLRTLADTDVPELRAAAVGAAAKLRGKPATDLLIASLSDPNERVRAAAINGLARGHHMLSGQDLTLLSTMLGDPDHFVRRRVIVALGATGGDEALRILERVATDPTHQGDQAYTILAYGLLGNPIGFRRAVKGLSNTEVRRSVDEILDREPIAIVSRFRENLNLQRENESPDSARRQADIATGLSNNSLASHYADDVRSHRKVERRVAALHALQVLGTATHRDLLLSTVRSDPSPEVRQLALQALADQLADPNVLSVFLTALRDPLAPVQLAAVTGIAQLRDARFNEQLLTEFVTENSDLRAAVINALANANAGEIQPFVDSLLGHSDQRILAGGAEVLGKIANPRVLGLLMAWLHSEHVPLRIATIRALGQLGSFESKEALIECLNDPNEDVRLATVQALGRICGGDVGALERICRDPSIKVRYALAEEIGRRCDRSLAPLLKHLVQDPVDDVRSVSMIALLTLSTSDTLIHFRQIFSDQPLTVQAKLRRLSRHHPGIHATCESARSHRDAATRICALEILDLLGQRPTALLLTALADPVAKARIVAARIAALSTDEEVRAALDQLVHDPDLAVRKAVQKSRLRLLRD